jgi:hypothetical protein
MDKEEEGASEESTSKGPILIRIDKYNKYNNDNKSRQV